MADAETLAPLHELIELYDYRVGGIDPMTGAPMLEDRMEQFTL